LVVVSEVTVNALQQYARAVGRARSFTTASLLSAGSSSVLALLLAPSQGTGGVLAAWLLGSAAAVVYLVAALGGGIRTRAAEAAPDPELRREMLRYGLPFAVATASWMLVLFVDRYFVEAFAGRAELGLYSLAFSVAHAPLFGLFMVIGFTSYTHSVEAYERGGPL